MQPADYIELLADVKLCLSITWEDEGTDRRLADIIHGGMAYLGRLLSGPVDLTQPGLPRTLFFEYCRYVWNEALDAFETNYQSLLVAMVNERRMTEYAQATKQEQQ